MRPPDVPPAGEPTDPVAVVPKEGEENEECVCMEGPEFCDYVGGLVHK